MSVQGKHHQGNGRACLHIIHTFCMQCGDPVKKRAAVFATYPASFCNKKCSGLFRSRLSAANFYRSTRRSDNGCLEWTGHRTHEGYGRLHYRCKVIGAHVMAWQLKNGDVPPGMFVCHKCDNPACVSLSHLFLGTPKDNSDDMMAKGRHFRKVTPEIAADIRASSDAPDLIARRHGISTGTVYRYLRGADRESRAAGSAA